MCFDLDSSPPIPPISGAAISHRSLVLTGANGNEFAAFAAQPDGRADVGIVVLPDRRGLYGFYEEVALRFAERGYAAIAIDYYGRSAGVSIAERGEDFDGAAHAQQTSAAQIQSDIAAAIGYLSSPEGGSPGTIFTVGFCFGGRASWLAASAGHGIAGAVGFYGHPGQHELVPGEGPTLRAPKTAAPILALQAGDDPFITADLNEAYDEALTAAGVEHEVITYEGAPHSFFDKHHEQFAAQSEDAWTRTIAFIERNSGGSEAS
jgi:carboxymethylenebutenolidase